MMIDIYSKLISAYFTILIEKVVMHSSRRYITPAYKSRDIKHPKCTFILFLHTYTHIYIYKHTNIHKYSYTHKNIYTCIHIRIQTHTYIIYMYMHIYNI